MATAALLSACGQASTGTVVPPALDGPADPSASASPSPGADTSAVYRGPTVVTWGRDAGLLSVVVRNDEPSEIVYARVRVTVRSTTGQILLRTAGERFSKGTTIAGLPPAHRYGLVLSLPPHASAIGSVDVTYVARSLRTTASHPALRLGRPSLTRLRHAAAVSVPITATAPVPPLVGVQAFLVDPRHRLVAVISGRFYCFDSSTRRILRMRLFRPVPPDTEVARVLAYPVPRDAPLPAPAVCD